MVAMDLLLKRLLYLHFAAYSGKSPLNIGLTSFPAIPLPNWRINYDGLMTIPYLKEDLDQYLLLTLIEAHILLDHFLVI